MKKNNKLKLIKNIIALSISIAFSAYADTSTTTFGVSANIMGACNLSAQDLNFGNVNLGLGATSSTTLTVNCPNGLNGQIEVNAGLNYDGNSRYVSQVVNSTTQLVSYELYSNAARTTPLVANTTLGIINIVGTGLDETIPIYGEIPVQPLKPVGIYNDTIQVNLNY